MSLEPVVNLLLVSLIPVVHLDLQISQLILERIQNDPNAIIRGLGEDDSQKKTRSKKTRDIVSLKVIQLPHL